MSQAAESPPRPAERERSSERTPWSAILGVWSIPALLSTATELLARLSAGRPVDVPEVARSLAFWLAWALVTPLIFRLGDRYPIARPHRVRAIATHLVTGTLLCAVLVTFLVALGGGGNGEMGADAEAGFGERLGSSLAWGVPGLIIIYFLLVGIGAALELRRRYRDRVLLTAELERELAEARLQALRMQLQPHFLFNTLHAISSLMDEEVATARRMIARLSELLRLALASDERPEVTLEEELGNLEAYLEIERIRLGDRLRVDYEIAAETLGLAVPTLLLQPLVENAVRHAVAPRIEGGTITLRSRLDGSRLALEVEDDGPGLAVTPPGNGVGLTNTRARIEQRYGDAGRFELGAGSAGGLVVRLALPSEAPGGS